jgi:hypothetical protein
MTLLKGTLLKTGRTPYEVETMAMRDDVGAKFEAWKNGGSEQAYRDAADAFNARCSSEEYFADLALANGIK